ncbi:MAG: hypothetical protein AAF808_09890, partial [Cyanobacteria bacterium P01_D01_bin.2]
PFEACLYYQVLPLSIEGSILNLGMVNTDDTTAADYVRRLVSYINCSIVSRPISSDWHREILSKFLSHSAKSRQTSQPTQSKPNSPSGPFADQPTLVVSSPTEIIENPHIPTPQPSSPQPTSAPNQVPPRPPLSIDLGDPLEEDGTDTKPEAENNLAQAPGAEVTFDPSQANPKELTQTLLKRLITQEGIGRLYLERQNTTCRILWSRDGVVQSVVDDIAPQVFQGVINELKRMMSLSLIPVRKPKQIEIERIHNQKRILLRFRVMPGENGEEATLQILRGAALKFYQQQQIDNIGRDALGIAHDLQQRIDELRTQAQRHLDVQDTKQKTLPAIMNMLKTMEQQLHEIIETPD